MGCSVAKISVVQDTNLETYIIKENSFLDYFLYNPFDLESVLDVKILEKRVCIDGSKDYFYSELGFFDLDNSDKILVIGNFALTVFLLFLILYGYFLGIKYIKNIYKKSKFILIIYIFVLILSLLFFILLFYLFLIFYSL